MFVPMLINKIYCRWKNNCQSHFVGSKYSSSEKCAVECYQENISSGDSLDFYLLDFACEMFFLRYNTILKNSFAVNSR